MSSSQTQFCVVSTLGPQADPAQNTLVVRRANESDARCRLAARHNSKLLCEHTVSFEELSRWVEHERDAGAGDDACPRCHRVGGRNKRRLRDIAVPFEDVFVGDDPELFDDAYVQAREQELRRRYGRYFLVVEWQGDNPEDSHYELYPFADQRDTYEGFLWRLRNHPADDPQLDRRSTAYVRGYQQASQQYVMWGDKFARLVFQSA